MTGAVGVYGGTFNPIHLGHLRAAEELVESLALERMIFVPSARPPHKREEEEELAPAELRLAWTRLAIEDNPRFQADPLELERDGPSYTVDTLRRLRERVAPSELVFGIGRDAFVEMGTWREPREIFRLANLAVTTRPPLSSGDLSDWLPACARPDFEIAADGLSALHREAGTRLCLVAITALDISASDIRMRLRNGRSTRYLLPEAVREAVVESDFYTRAA